MNPIPCAHCGVNFMRPTMDPEAPKLCNNCSLREEKRHPTKGKPMDTVDILIKCPIETHIEIEEICINNGGDFSKYFLGLHEKAQGAGGLCAAQDSYCANKKEKSTETFEESEKPKGKKK